MSLGLIILNYRDKVRSLAALLKAKEMGIFSALILVDNGSGDGSKEYFVTKLSLEKIGAFNGNPVYESRGDANISLICNSENLGYGAGNNIGIKWAVYRYGIKKVLVANPDALFTKELILKMLGGFNDSRVAAVGALMGDNPESCTEKKRENSALSADKGSDFKNTFDLSSCRLSGWKKRGFKEELINTLPICKRIFAPLINYGELYYKKGMESGFTRVFALHGSLIMFDSEAFLRVGGFDEDFFLYMEESVIGEKLRKLGRLSLLCMDTYIHEGSKSIDNSYKSMLSKEKLRIASERKYYKKYLNAGKIAMSLATFTELIVLIETCILDICHRGKNNG